MPLRILAALLVVAVFAGGFDVAAVHASAKLQTEVTQVAVPLANAITYQGRLQDGDGPVDAVCDLTFLALCRCRGRQSARQHTRPRQSDGHLGLLHRERSGLWRAVSGSSALATSCSPLSCRQWRLCDLDTAPAVVRGPVCPLCDQQLGLIRQQRHQRGHPLPGHHECRHPDPAASAIPWRCGLCPMPPAPA